MKFGVVSHTGGRTTSPVELGKELMARDLQALFVPEHSHIPVKRETRWAGLTHADQPATGDPMFVPDWYENALDPFISLAAAATASPGLVVGTGVALASQRHAISFAKAVSSLEAVIGPDRFVCGVAPGWNVEEMRNHGVSGEQRWPALRETVEAAIQIWTHEEAEYHGAVVDFDPIRSFPKPATRPYPPVLFGGHSRATLDRVVAIGDGWMPVAGRGSRPTAEDIEAGMTFLARRAAETGRTFVTVVIDVRADAGAVERYRDMGVERFLFGGPPLDRDEMLRQLDVWADIVSRIG